MTREEVNRAVAQMERVREESYEAASRDEERRLIREYDKLSQLVEPYLCGKRTYDLPRD